MDLRGHYWTITPRLRHALRPLAAPASRPWETWIEDPVAGRVRLTGRLAEAGDGGELLLVVHGLGGCTESHTAVRTARAAAAAGLGCLRLNLRGSDRLGDDFYHAALTADLHAALASRELAGYRRLYVFGWSLGGHLALRLATELADPRLAAVAAVCAPLDLAASVDAIDRAALWAYRRAVLGGLKEIYAACASGTTASSPHATASPAPPTTTPAPASGRSCRGSACRRSCSRRSATRWCPPRRCVPCSITWRATAASAGWSSPGCAREVTAGFRGRSTSPRKKKAQVGKKRLAGALRARSLPGCVAEAEASNSRRAFFPTQIFSQPPG